MKSYKILVKTELGWECAGIYASLKAAKRHLKHYAGKETRLEAIPYRGGTI